MRQTLLLSILVFSITNVFAQNPDKVLARVDYTFSDKSDTLRNGRIRKENMLLFVGKNSSLYASYDRLRYYIGLDQKIRAKMMNMIDGAQKTISVDQTESKWMSNTNQLYFINENKHYIIENISDQGYLVDDPQEPISWKIIKDTLSFSGIKCQKALATVDGINWEVWFASSIPFQSGPWKLNGLPGLIIEAQSQNKDIYFKFAGIENATEGNFKRTHDVTKRVNNDPDIINTIDVMLGFDVAAAYFENTIKIPSHTSKATKSELLKFRKAVEKDEKGIHRTQSRF